MAQTLDNLSFQWNNVATTFTGIKYNVTDTASAAGSLLMDLQVGGVSKFKVDKAGTVSIPTITGVATSGAPSLSFVPTSGIAMGLEVAITGSALLVKAGTTSSLVFRGNAVDFAADASLRWTNGNGNPLTTLDLILVRDGAAGTLAQRNSTNAQTFRVYNTFTTATDYQRLAVSSATATLTAMSGASVTATNLIPAGAVVVGVTARVSTEITGATGFQIGTATDADRWGDKTGVAVGTTTDNRDWTAGTIECFPTATNVIVTAKTSNFTAGAMTVVVHYLAGEAD
jgi:hypothetical protein